MKKTLIAALVSSVVLAGCSSFGGADTVTPAELQAQYSSVLEKERKVSTIKEINLVATSVNGLFEQAYPIYTDYVEYVNNSAGDGAAHASAVAMLETEEEREAYIADLKESDPQAFNEYYTFVTDAKMKDIAARAAAAAAKIALESKVFTELDTAGAMKASQLDFRALIAEKEVVSQIIEQLDVLNSSVVALVQEYDANKAAELLK